MGQPGTYQMPQVQNPQPSSNPVFQPPAYLNQIKGLMGMMKSGGNIQSMVQNMLMNNPQTGAIMNVVNQHGGDYKAAFYDMAKQKGVDPNQIINMLK